LLAIGYENNVANAGPGISIVTLCKVVIAAIAPEPANDYIVLISIPSFRDTKTASVICKKITPPSLLALVLVIFD